MGFKNDEFECKKNDRRRKNSRVGAPDFEYMELYSKNIFAQVLKRYFWLTK